MPNLLPADTILTATKGPDILEIKLIWERSDTGGFTIKTASSIAPALPNPVPFTPSQLNFIPGSFLDSGRAYATRVQELKQLRTILNTGGFVTTLVATGLSFL
jgi:hypothetical protein